MFSLLLALSPPPMTTDEMIADLVKNQFVFSGETDKMQAERAKTVKTGGRTR